MNEGNYYIMHSISLEKEKPIFPNNLITPSVYTLTKQSPLILVLRETKPCMKLITTPSAVRKVSSN